MHIRLILLPDSRYYVTDPEVVHVPVKELLSKEYLHKRAKLFDPTKAAVDVRHVRVVRLVNILCIADSRRRVVLCNRPTLSTSPVCILRGSSSAPNADHI